LGDLDLEIDERIINVILEHCGVKKLTEFSWLRIVWRD
jgi:hypothetical protein